MMMADKLQPLKQMSIVYVSREYAEELALQVDPDYFSSFWYRRLGIVDVQPEEIGCHLRAMARYVLDKSA